MSFALCPTRGLPGWTGPPFSACALSKEAWFRALAGRRPAGARLRPHGAQLAGLWGERNREAQRAGGELPYSARLPAQWGLPRAPATHPPTHPPTHLLNVSVRNLGQLGGDVGHGGGAAGGGGQGEGGGGGQGEGGGGGQGGGRVRRRDWAGGSCRGRPGRSGAGSRASGGEAPNAARPECPAQAQRAQRSAAQYRAQRSMASAAQRAQRRPHLSRLMYTSSFSIRLTGPRRREKPQRYTISRARMLACARRDWRRRVDWAQGSCFA